jgi:hypothetical protein
MTKKTRPGSRCGSVGARRHEADRVRRERQSAQCAARDRLDVAAVSERRARCSVLEPVDSPPPERSVQRLPHVASSRTTETHMCRRPFVDSGTDPAFFGCPVSHCLECALETLIAVVDGNGCFNSLRLRAEEKRDPRQLRQGCVARCVERLEVPLDEVTIAVALGKRFLQFASREDRRCSRPEEVVSGRQHRVRNSASRSWLMVRTVPMRVPRMPPPSPVRITTQTGVPEAATTARVSCGRRIWSRRRGARRDRAATRRRATRCRRGRPGLLGRAR